MRLPKKSVLLVALMSPIPLVSLVPAIAGAAPAAPPEAAPPPAAQPPTTAPAQPPAAPPSPAAPPAAAAPAEPPPAEPPPAEPPPAEPPPAEPPPAEPPPATEDGAPPDTQPEPPPESAAPPPTSEPEAPAHYRVAEDAWQAMLEQQVVVQVDDIDDVRGKLVAVTDSAVVVLADDGQIHTVQKSDAAALRSAEPEAALEEPASSNEEEAAATEPAKDEGARKSPKLGIFTSHGVAYAHWRTPAYRAGGLAYAVDVGGGYNFRDNLGIYGVLGGHLGARLVKGTIKGRTGHFGALLRYRSKKRAVLMGGLALAWSHLEEPQVKVREVGVAIPLKAMGQFDLGKDFYLAVGLGYQPSFFARGRIANALSLQATFARW